MNAPGLLRLVNGSLRTGWLRAAALCAALGVLCLCFSAAGFAGVYSEKHEPCELSVTAASGGALTEQDVSALLALDDVRAATGIVEVSAAVTSGKYTATLTLTGIDPDYLQAAFSGGGLFPEDSAMPWIVLNKAAQELFVDPDDNTRKDETYMPDIDWLSDSFTLTLGGDDTRAAGVCGCLDDGGDEPKAYISRQMAQQLLRGQGQSQDYVRVLLRITDIGAAEDVEASLTELGLAAENLDTQQQETWKAETRQAAYLALLAAALLGGTALLAVCAWRDGLVRWAALFADMERLGLTRRTLRGAVGWKLALTLLLGALLGLWIYSAVPVLFAAA